MTIARFILLAALVAVSATPARPHPQESECLGLIRKLDKSQGERRLKLLMDAAYYCGYDSALFSRFHHEALELALRHNKLTIAVEVCLRLHSREIVQNTVVATTYLDSAYVLAGQLGNDLIMGRILLAYARVCDRRAQYDSAVYYIDSARQKFDKDKPAQELAQCYDLLGLIKIRTGNYRDALSFLAQALDLMKESGDKQTTAAIHYRTGICFYRLGNHEAALRCLNIAIEISKEISDNARLWNALELTGHIYTQLSNYPKALALHRQALSVRWNEVNKLHHDPETSLPLAYSFNNIGKMFLLMQQYDSAWYYIRKSYSIKLRALSGASPNDVATSLSNLADFHHSTGQPDSAIYYNNMALLIFSKNQNRTEIFRRMLVGARIYYDAQQVSKAAASAFRLLESLPEYENREDYPKLYSLLSDIEYKRGDLNRSLDFYKKFHHLSDSLLMQEQAQKVENLRLGYAFTELENRNIRIAGEIKQKTRLIRLYLILLASLVIAVAALVSVLRLKIKTSRQSKILAEVHRDRALLEEEKHQQEVRHKNNELGLIMDYLLQKNLLLDRVGSDLERFLQQGNQLSYEKIRELIQSIRLGLNLDKDWAVFRGQVEQANHALLHRLKQAYPSLSAQDLRFCIYIHLNLTSKEIANLLNISQESVKKHRYRLRRKLNLERGVKLEHILFEFGV